MAKRRSILGSAALVLLSISAGVGAAAILYRLLVGLTTTNITGTISWGLWVVFYIYFIGLSAGSFLLSTLVFVFGIERFEPVGRLAIFSALMALAAGLLFIFLDLGHYERFITVYTHRNWNSVLTWEIHFYAAYIFILLGELYLLLRRDLVILARNSKGLMWVFYRAVSLYSDRTDEAANRRDHSLIRILGFVGLPIAIGVHGGTGALFAVLKARPYWFGGLFPVVFVISAIASGGALLAGTQAYFGRKDENHAGLTNSLASLAAGVLAFDLLMLLSETFIGIYSDIPEHNVVFEAIMQGPFSWVFWGVQLLIGAVIPVAMILSGRWKDRPKILGLACFSMVFGILGVRANIVVPSQTVEAIHGLFGAYVDARSSHFYFPSWPEYLSSMGVIACVLLASVIGYRLLPITWEPTEHAKNPHDRAVVSAEKPGGALETAEKPGGAEHPSHVLG